MTVRLAEEGVEFGANFGEFMGGGGTFSLGTPLAPIEALNLIGQNRAGRRAGDEHFERVILDLGRRRISKQGAAKHQAGLNVVCRRT